MPRALRSSSELSICYQVFGCKQITKPELYSIIKAAKRVRTAPAAPARNHCDISKKYEFECSLSCGSASRDSIVGACGLRAAQFHNERRPALRPTHSLIFPMGVNLSTTYAGNV
jgi:hypothetical protein